MNKYYLEKADIPHRIIIDCEEDYSLAEKWLGEKSGHKVSFLVPKTAEPLKLLEMCLNNAAEYLSEKTLSFTVIVKFLYNLSSSSTTLEYHLPTILGTGYCLGASVSSSSVAPITCELEGADEVCK